MALAAGVGSSPYLLLLKFKASITSASWLQAPTGKTVPTEAAGAIVDGRTAKTTQNQGLDPNVHLRDNNSNEFLRRRKSCMTTGPSGTNVMDLAIMLVD